MKKMPVVEVEWVDITSYSNWRELEEAKSASPTSIKSVGYLISKDPHNVRIAMTISEDMGIAVTKVIPTGVIKKVRRVG